MNAVIAVIAVRAAATTQLELMPCLNEVETLPANQPPARDA